MRKKILHILPILASGGAPINVLRFISLSSVKIDNFLVARSENDQMIKEAQTKCTEYIDLDISKFKLLSAIKLCLVVYKINPNIVHTNGKCGLIYGLILKLFFPFKTFYHTYRGFYLPNDKASRFIHSLLEVCYRKLVDGVVCVSPSEKHKVESSIGRSAKIRIIENGISINGSQCLNIKIESSMERFDLNIVSLSRICEQKDILTMLMVFEHSNINNAALHIIGGIPEGGEEYNQKVRSLLDTLKCKSSVFFWGDVHNASAKLANFNIYLSTAKFEGLPTAIIEAGLSQVPVVATPCVGNIDLVNKDTGYLSDSFNVVDISSALVKCCKELQTPKQKVIVSNALMQSNRFSVENNVSKYFSLYKIN